MIKVICGSNSYAAKNQLKSLTSDFVSEFGDLALEKIDCTDASKSEIVTSLGSVPFLASRKMVVLLDLSTNKELSEKIEEIIANVGEDVVLVIFESKVDKRSAYYKTIKKLEGFTEFDLLEPSELTSWLQHEAKKYDAKLSSDVANYLLQVSGANQEALSREIQKLADYNPIINKSSIDLLVEQNPQSTVFQLLDRTFSGDIKGALSLYNDQRAQGAEPMQIIGLFAWQFNAIAIVQAAGDKSNEEISKDSGLKPFVVQKSRVISAKLGRNKTNRLINDLVELDRGLKSGADQEDAMKNFLIKLAE